MTNSARPILSALVFAFTVIGALLLYLAAKTYLDHSLADASGIGLIGAGFLATAVAVRMVALPWAASPPFYWIAIFGVLAMIAQFASQKLHHVASDAAGIAAILSWTAVGLAVAAAVAATVAIIRYVSGNAEGRSS